ncbi:hypothetical protein FXO38_12355 [Capsicum annuum]|uniref:Uncharacterized protein n=1 Tax=Capsicum annuum TaxID=4072 RepID=A0A2G2Z3Q0_CAPAN|nr:hypothetical protein FXO38_12355 [Capsicum annuum]KAF3662604.1 hypothetical protein FXO37_12368 [Capsicum annuum]PHT76650.1 hypothetical protein T459_20172 [Capsicum annuum]
MSQPVVGVHAPHMLANSEEGKKEEPKSYLEEAITGSSSGETRIEYSVKGEQIGESRSFTWTNHHVFIKIDRALANGDWMLLYPQAQVYVMNPHFSDHSPLKIKISEDIKGGPKSFRFINYLKQHDDFIEVVRHGWAQQQCSGAMENIWMKLKTVKPGLK